MHTALESEVCEWIDAGQGESTTSEALGSPALRTRVCDWLREIAPRLTLEQCEVAAGVGLRAGCELAWVTCEYCGHPHLDSGDSASVVHSQFECIACGAKFVEAASVVANPLAAWGVALDSGTLVVRKCSPGVASRGTSRLLAVDDTILARDGLPTASSGELGASRIQEQQLRAAADIGTLNMLSPGKGGTAGRRCARIPVPH